MRKTRLNSFIGLVRLAIMLSATAGCTLVDTHVDVIYPPSAATAAVPGASGTVVEVSITDDRTEHRDQVGAYPQQVGVGGPIFVAAASSGPGAFIPNQNIPDLVTRAMADELAARGFTVGSGGVRLRIALKQFYESTTMKFLGVKTSATVRFEVEVPSATKAAFGRDYADTVTENYSIDTAGNAVARLQKAFHNAVVKAAGDPDLQHALESASGH